MKITSDMSPIQNAKMDEKPNSSSRIKKGNSNEDPFDLQLKISPKHILQIINTDSKYCGSDDNCTGCGCNTCCSSC